MTAVDVDPVAVEVTRANAPANGVEVDAPVLDASEATSRPAAVVVANIAPEPVAALSGRLRCERAITSGYLASDEPASPGFRAWSGSSWTAGRPTCTCRSSILRFDGAVLGPLPGLQGLAHGRASGARAALATATRRLTGAPRDVAVVNTCCVTHEAGLEVAAGGVAGGAHAPPRLRDRLRCEPRGRVRRTAGQRRRRRGPSEATPAAVAGDVGAIGCVQADARLERVRAFVKIQDGCSFSCAFCVIPLVRGHAEPSRRSRARRDPAPRRPGPSGGRAHRRQPRLLPRPRGGLHAGAADPRGGRGRRVSSGLRLSSIEINHVGDDVSRRCARRRRSRSTSTCRSSPATTASCAMGRRYTVETYLRKLERSRTSTSRAT